MLMLKRTALMILIVTVISLFANYAYCADGAKKEGLTGDSSFTEIGFITGAGTGSLPEGNYQPIYLVGHFGVEIKRYFSGLKSHKGTLSVFLEPQFNPVVSPQTDFEAGVGIGLKYMYPVFDKLSIYILGSVGPHYISVQTSKQANGFLFADTIGGGFYYYLTKDAAINLGYRLRHMSNANTADPNGEIDTNSAVIGYSVFFE